MYADVHIGSIRKVKQQIHIHTFIDNMARKHELLHPDLVAFNIYEAFGRLLSSEEKAICFLREINLLPSRNSLSPKCCGMDMFVENSDIKLGWVWRCSTKAMKKKGSKACRKTVNPGSGTFFDGHHCHISYKEILAIVISFVMDMKVSDDYENLCSWREREEKPTLSWSTVIDYYSYCREVAEVLASHSETVLGREGKAVQIDNTFLTKRKYNLGRLSEQMTIVVLGLYCKEDKTGLFFKVNAMSKAELWPYIKK